LRAGDLLSTDSGQWKEVEKTVPAEGAETVYNFRVADHHTYFVGRASWGFAVWAHNCYSPVFRADHPFHFFIRDNSSSTMLFMGRITDPSQTDNELNPRRFPNNEPGDANRDLQFDSLDIVQVLQSAKYLTGETATFEEGDWNSDGVFNQFDIVAALQTGNYLRGPFASVAETEFEYA
jgi:hypothetical protein